MVNLTYKTILRLIILAFLTIILFTYCSRDDQNLTFKNKQDAISELKHLKNLLPPGTPYKILRNQEDKFDENKIYLIDQKKEETLHLLEL